MGALERRTSGKPSTPNAEERYGDKRSYRHGRRVTGELKRAKVDRVASSSSLRSGKLYEGQLGRKGALRRR